MSFLQSLLSPKICKLTRIGESQSWFANSISGRVSASCNIEEDFLGACAWKCPPLPPSPLSSACPFGLCIGRHHSGLGDPKTLIWESLFSVTKRSPLCCPSSAVRAHGWQLDMAAALLVVSEWVATHAARVETDRRWSGSSYTPLLRCRRFPAKWVHLVYLSP